MTKQNEIVALINKYLKSAKTGLKTYRENIQTAYEIFVANYNDKLTYNSTPLLNLLKSLNANDKKMMLDYIKLTTNIKTCKVVKDKITLVFNNVTDDKKPLQYNDKIIDSVKWYDKAKKEESKPLTLDEESLLKRLTGLLTLAKKSSLTDEQIKKAFNTALTAKK